LTLRQHIEKAFAGLQAGSTSRDLDGLEAIPEAHFNPDVSGGWEGRSSDFPYQRFVVFEVGDIVRSQSFNAYALGDGMRYKQLKGSWRGVSNASFIVEDTSTNRVKLAYWLRGQKSVLCLGPAYRKGPDGQSRLYGNREAILDWLDNDGYTVKERTPLPGLFQPVSRAKALALEAWTFDPKLRQYFAVV
jgi:hypothetical protein